jgi:hypothetical protein
MVDKHTEPESPMQPQESTVRYERKDIRFGCLLAVMLVAAGVVAVLGYTVWRFFWWEARSQDARNRSAYPLRAPSIQLPPEPRLEQLDRMARTEGADVYDNLAADEKQLNSYGATDEKGFVHIPIQKAMQTIAGQLRVRKQSPGSAATDNGLLDSGESNSGRIFRGERQ